MRAGLDSSDFSQNMRIGSVSSPADGEEIDFTVDYGVIARFVSVELLNVHRSGQNCLQLAEVLVEETTGRFM